MATGKCSIAKGLGFKWDFQCLPPSLNFESGDVSDCFHNQEPMTERRRYVEHVVCPARRCAGGVPCTGRDGVSWVWAVSPGVGEGHSSGVVRKRERLPRIVPIAFHVPDTRGMDGGGEGAAFAACARQARSR